ncbi:hypothetical protein IAQ67_06465 [Paenibacillus peoriae]|uniref:Uncharacterized protein n=1 Tax=Paenibacillus peoriae TaxID=59893 RepID=A0A7H0YC71_9BACL|nr:hypothetical protein AM598_09155 [Paenibacillus polymyxa]QNR68679.1 hypothetical protein IAQ67_06465 [Paenibacillus peoriae]
MHSDIRDLNARFFALILPCAAFFGAGLIDYLELIGTREYIHYNHIRMDGMSGYAGGRNKSGELQT